MDETYGGLRDAPRYHGHWQKYGQPELLEHDLGQRLEAGIAHETYRQRVVILLI